MQPLVPSQPANEIAKKRDIAISSSHLHRLQRRHFVLFDVLPLIGTMAAISLLWVRSITDVDMALLAVMWLITGLALTAGFHRLFAHGAYSTSKPVAVAFVILGSMAGRGSMISWVTIHRRHHQYADRTGDVHSPNLTGKSTAQRLRGWLHAHETWLLRHDYPSPAFYSPDLLRQPALVKANRYYYHWVMLGLIVPACVGGLWTCTFMGALTGFLWGGPVRMLLVAQSMSTINSFLHLLGTKPFNTNDGSRNAAVLSLPLWGEAWHNNHHAFPYSAAFGLTWYQLDPGFWIVRTLQLLRLAWNVKLPQPSYVEARRKSTRDGTPSSA